MLYRKIFILLFIFCSLCFSKGGHGGGGRGGGNSHGSHTSIVSHSSPSSSNNKNLTSKKSYTHSITSYTPVHNNTHSNGNLALSLIMIIICLFFNFRDKLINHKIKRNKVKKFKQNTEEYCTNFIMKFTNLENIPNEYDIKEAYDVVGRNKLINNILIQLIINKLKIIDNFSIEQQYNFFYLENINKIDLFQLASNTVSKNIMKQTIATNNEINNFLNNNKYIKIKFANMTDCMSGLHNKYLLGYGTIVNTNNENVLRIYFNQQLIFQEILLKEHDIVIENILKEMEDYKYCSELILADNKQILMNAIVNNILENKIFSEQFLNKLNEKSLLNLKNHTTFLIRNCNNKEKIKKYNKLLANL